MGESFGVLEWVYIQGLVAWYQLFVLKVGFVNCVSAGFVGGNRGGSRGWAMGWCQLLGVLYVVNLPAWGL